MAYSNIKELFNEAAQRTVSEKKHTYDQLTREIVSIERETFYGEEPESRRLSRIRKLIQNHVKNQAEKNED